MAACREEVLGSHGLSEIAWSLLSKDLEAASDLEIAARVFLVLFSEVSISKQNWDGEETVPPDLGRKDRCGSVT